MNKLFAVQQRAHVLCLATVLAFWFLATTAWSQRASEYYVHSTVPGDTLVHLAKRYLIKPNDW